MSKKVKPEIKEQAMLSTGVVLNNLASATINQWVNDNGDQRTELVIMHAAHFLVSGHYVPAASIIIRGKGDIKKLLDLFHAVGVDHA